MKCRITLRCDKKGFITTAENVIPPAFKCPACGDPLVYLHNEHKLGGHGKSDVSIGHTLRQVTELNEESGQGTSEPSTAKTSKARP